MRVDIPIKYFWIPLILSGASLNAQYMISISNIWRSEIFKEGITESELERQVYHRFLSFDLK